MVTTLFLLPWTFQPRPLSPASCPKHTHHYGANYRAFDHPPQSRVVIHIPAAVRQAERREMMLGSGESCKTTGWHVPPVALKGGWLKGALRDCTPKPNPAPSALVLSSAPLSRQ